MQESEINQRQSRDGISLPTLEGNLQFSNVIFSYPSRPDVQILHGLDMSVKPGQTVALVGPSGCGKSTIIKLLLRIYECSGSVSIVFIIMYPNILYSIHQMFYRYC